MSKYMAGIATSTNVDILKRAFVLRSKRKSRMNTWCMDAIALLNVLYGTILSFASVQEKGRPQST